MQSHRSSDRRLLSARTGHPARAWSVHCSACGSCCNSAPLLSIPELFHHRHRLVGVLGIRKMARIVEGWPLGPGGQPYLADADDCAAFEQLATDCLHRSPGLDFDVLLAPQAFDDPGSARCSALGPDGRCTIHTDCKPAACVAVPFEPLMPDRLQHLVLAERWADSDEMGARCIVRKSESDENPTVAGAHVVDRESRQALAARRQAMAADKRCWGRQVFADLVPELSLHKAQAIPSAGFWVIPLAPIIAMLAAVSQRCRERCLDYLDAQIVLCEHLAKACAAGLPPPHGAPELRLRASLRTNRALRELLLPMRRPEPRRDGIPASEIEAWLESPSPSSAAPIEGPR